ncbi:hypothetical protein F3Y22_tig00005465pilonHSYRG00001 [Hibiscus syriacus]|uniref:Pentatricopeptide repeat-containing protein n=1 Tax=Hibiscus syriacus TaxID=106335 RepID=A0A6A3CJH9_HIBSY|nr:hypothetical protein F3Y22_tig00005465pilonHSYRG00001 [Hibiscus syriacus]
MPDVLSLSGLVKGCGSLEQNEIVHGVCLRLGFGNGAFWLVDSLRIMVKVGTWFRLRSVFRVCLGVDNVVLTAMLCGYFGMGNLKRLGVNEYTMINVLSAVSAEGLVWELDDARCIFDDMVLEFTDCWIFTDMVLEFTNCWISPMNMHGLNVEVNIASILEVASDSSSLHLAVQIHSLEKSFADIDETTVIHLNAMLSTLVNADCHADSVDLFQNMVEMTFSYLSTDNLAAWNAMITGYAQHGLLQEAQSYMNSMVESPGRCKSTIDEMPIEPDALIWQILLSACCLHGTLILEELQRANFLSCSLVTNLPNSSFKSLCFGGMWTAVRKKRNEGKLLCKEPGPSWIQVRGFTHYFFADDMLHPKNGIVIIAFGTENIELNTQKKDGGEEGLFQCIDKVIGSRDTGNPSFFNTSFHFPMEIP